VRNPELESILSDVLAASDTPAAHRLCRDCRADLIRNGAASAIGLARSLLRAVLDYREAERALALRGGFCEPEHKAGGVRGPCERPAGVACWWLGRRETATKTLPAMGWCGAGERLPKEARWWCVEGQGYWWRLPSDNGGG